MLIRKDDFWKFGITVSSTGLRLVINYWPSNHVYSLVDPTDSEVMGQPHAMVEKKLGLL